LSHLHNSRSIPPLRITILADDSYYSKPPTGQSIGSFSNFGVALHEAHKTGLGSSAALVTSLTAALLVFLGRNLFHDLTDATTQKRIHNLAQASHCAAQGKVGSGFDVAAAVYGSCLYRRFSPEILSNIGDIHSPGFGERLHRCVEDLNPVQWDVEVSSKAVEIPRSLLLLMCDVDCGSETPGMVKKVLAWRKKNPDEALLLWTALQQGTEDLCRSLTKLAKAEVDELTMDDQNKLSDIIQTIRSMVRDMSAKSQVPIEPPVITELLDYCTGLPGVVGGVAPGAGGYDAVALLVRNDVEVVRDLEKRLQGWKTSSEASKGATIGKVSLLKVQQEWDGVKVEDVSRYESWVK
jgi:phosphomevalonate kinase